MQLIIGVFTGWNNKAFYPEVIIISCLIEMKFSKPNCRLGS